MASDRHPDNVDMLVDWGELDGFQMPSRARGISEWREKKEDEEFDKLCRRLKCRNYARRRREEDPEGMRQANQAWRDANREHVRQMERTRRAHKKAKLPPLICQNPRCRKPFYPERNRKGTKWCSRECSNNYHAVIRSRRKNQGIRNMDLAKAVFRILHREPWLTLGEIAERATGAKRGSIATKLTEWAKEGVLKHDGKKKWRRYALAEEGSHE